MDLRTRRRLRTMRDVKNCALQLVADRGYENVTAEMICEAAGISQRTFFNYFPFKEAALVGTPPPFPEDAAEAFIAGRGALAEDLAQLMAARFEGMGAQDRRGLVLLADLVERHPKLLAMHIAALHRLEADLEGLLQARAAAGRDAAAIGDPEAAAVLSAAAFGAVRCGLMRWSRGEDDGTPAEAVRCALARLRDVLAVPKAPGPE